MNPNYITQQQKVYDLLSSPNPEGYTRMQIAKCLGIERASVCRRVAELQDAGVCWVVSKGLDPITKERAEKLTCNRQVAMGLPRPERAVKQKAEQTGKLF